MDLDFSRIRLDFPSIQLLVTIFCHLLSRTYDHEPPNHFLHSLNFPRILQNTSFSLPSLFRVTCIPPTFPPLKLMMQLFSHLFIKLPSKLLIFSFTLREALLLSLYLLTSYIKSFARPRDHSLWCDCTGTDFASSWLILLHPLVPATLCWSDLEFWGH